MSYSIPFSDPLTLPAYRDMRYFCNTLIHELIHQLFEQGNNMARCKKAWEFIFGIVPRIVIASILAEIISELTDTEVYQWWTSGIGKNKPQWLRVIISNSISIPIDSLLFASIAFIGVISSSALVIMILSNILVKAVITAASFWMIYLVPEKPIYQED